MEFRREAYIDRLVRNKGNGLIKIVTGVRRSGKSYLLGTLFRRRLNEDGVDDGHIIAVSLEDCRRKELREPENMLAYIDALTRDGGEYCVIIDEVQELGEFDTVLNTLLIKPGIDLYVTGSNSRFLSSDIKTEFRGRGFEIRLRPLTFHEIAETVDGERSALWKKYFTYGGLPLVWSLADDDKAQYLKNLFDETYITDIIERHKVRRRAELGELLNILASSAGSLTNPAKLSRTFKSVKGSPFSDKTIRNYIEYFIDSFLINEAQRYDVKGKRYIGALSKYYFEDAGLRNARLNFRQMEENHIMENIIYNELLARGFNVDVGVVPSYGRSSGGSIVSKQLEIDFVANKGGERRYIQSALSIDEPRKAKAEKAPFAAAGDSFKKIIVVRNDIVPYTDDDGVTIMGIFDFLLDGKSTE